MSRRDATGTRPSLARLVAVELRKSTDTRAGGWLLATVGALTVAVVAVRLTTGPATGRTFGSLVADAQLPVSVLLPVVGLLSVTGEWSQRTALATFSLVPARGRVVAAKVLAVSLLALAATGVAVAAAAVGFTLGRTAGGWHVSAAVVVQLALVNGTTMLCGTAFGLLLRYSAPAVVVYYMVPLAWSVAGRLVPTLEPTARWLDVGQARVPLVAPGVTGTEWARFATSALLWVAVPALLGVLRIRRAEVS